MVVQQLELVIAYRSVGGVPREEVSKLLLREVSNTDFKALNWFTLSCLYKFGMRKPQWGASERGLAWYVTTRLDVLDTA